MISTRTCPRCISGLPLWFAVFLFSWAILPGGNAAFAQAVVAIGQNFTAGTLGPDSSALPPDADGTAGPLHYVEFINGRFSVFDKRTGARVKTMTDLAFWNQAGVTFPSGWDTSDPRIVFDPASQRWFASQVDFDPSLAVNTNRFLLAISTGPDPTGTWRAVAIWSDPGGNNSADFPTLGIDGQAVYLSGDMFDTNQNPVGPTLVSIPKTSLLANPPSSSGLKSFGILSYDVRGNILQPAICLDGSDQGSVLAADSVGTDVNGNTVTNTLLVDFQVQNPTMPTKTTLTSSSFLSVTPYTLPPYPLQPDGSTNLDGGDARISASVNEVGGVLYAAHSTEIGGLAAIHWYRIDAVQHTVLETGTISDPINDLYYPSIAANSAGTIVIAYNASGPSTFPSSFAVVGSTAAGVTTFGNPLLLKSGTASYQNTDPSSGTSRWGDYSATCVDPADPTRFWTIQTIATGTSVWSTQVTELLTGIPQLRMSANGGNLQLTWSGTLFSLETTPSLASPTWTTVNQGFSTNNGVVTAQLPLNTAAGFFRLHAP